MRSFVVAVLCCGRHTDTVVEKCNSLISYYSDKSRKHPYRARASITAPSIIRTAYQRGVITTHGYVLRHPHKRERRDANRSLPPLGATPFLLLLLLLLLQQLSTQRAREWTPCFLNTNANTISCSISPYHSAEILSQTTSPHRTASFELYAKCTRAIARPTRAPSCLPGRRRRRPHSTVVVWFPLGYAVLAPSAWLRVYFNCTQAPARAAGGWLYNMHIIWLHFRLAAQWDLYFGQSRRARAPSWERKQRERERQWWDRLIIFLLRQFCVSRRNCFNVPF